MDKASLLLMSAKIKNELLHKMILLRAMMRGGFLLSGSFLVACSGVGADLPMPSAGHLQISSPTLPITAASAPLVVERNLIPPLLKPLPILPPPTASVVSEARYSVVVRQALVQDLLFALGRDAKLNLDVHPAVTGYVTLNAIQQTVPQIMKRLSTQVAIRYHLEGNTLSVVPDTPYLVNYPIDYVNVERKTTSSVSLSSSIASTGGSVQSNNQTGGNASSTTLTNTSENLFWKTLQANVRAILLATQGQENRDEQQSAQQREDFSDRLKLAEAVAHAGAGASGLYDKVSLPRSPSAAQTRASATEERVIVNPEAGLLGVYATEQQHEKIREFLRQVLKNAGRQVLVEATLVEVELNDAYQAGVDWNLAAKGGLNFTQNLLGNASIPVNSALVVAPLNVLTYTPQINDMFGGRLSATMQWLQQFGNTKVLSSPKMMALNNQTSLLKVVDEKVYFTTKLEIVRATSTTPEERTYSSELHTVPVGMVMSITPQISEDEQVTLNIRPTISRITDYKTDPAPRLAGANFDNLIPQIQVRELESVLKLRTGQIAVLGGLIQDTLSYKKDGLPGLGNLPVVGDAFNVRDEKKTKTELVIFLRPTVIHHPSVQKDFQEFAPYLPDTLNQRIKSE